MGGLIFGSFPAKTNAGVFSFVSKIFKAAKAVTPENQPNSQKMAILEAPIAANPSIGGGEISILDDSVLEAQGEHVDENILKPQSDRISVYVVRKGDTLSQIAAMYDISVNTILWANDIQGRIISEGQTLVILPVTGVQYTVKKGDTLADIAKKYDADVKEVASFNEITVGSALSLGQKIIIPDGVDGTQNSNTGRSPARPATSKFTNLPKVEGYFKHPAPGSIKSQGIHGYNAVDLAAPAGSPIYASAGGQVTVSRDGWNGGYGNYVVIYHPNGTQTLYAHLSSRGVSAGDRVEKGQQIGLMGRSGKATGDHLHFEVRGARNPF